MLLGCAAAAALATAGCEEDPPFVKFIPAPGGKLKAALVTYAGGGGISPYCIDNVTIVPSTATAEDAQKKDFLIFSGECSSFSVENGVMESSPRIEWLSDHALRITFSLRDTFAFPQKFELKRSDASHAVSIAYEVRE
jgi:hypothetical protein